MIEEDCSKADMVVGTIPVGLRACRNSTYLIDRFDLWRNGHYVVFLNPDGIVVKSTGGDGILRPRSRYPGLSNKDRSLTNNGAKSP